MNKSKQVEYYNVYVSRQVAAGINERHHSIIKKMLKLGLKKHMHVLEIGCGIGTVSELLLKHLTNGTLLALDLSPDSIEVARQRLKKYKNAEFKAADIIETDIKAQFNMIMLPDVLEHIPLEQHHDMFIKLKQLLQPDGKIVIHIPNPYHLDYCRAQGMEMQIIDQGVYLTLLINNLKDTGLFISYLEVYNIWVNEGDYQFIVLENEEKFTTFTSIIKKNPFYKKLKDKILYEYKKRFKK